MSRHQEFIFKPFPEEVFSGENLFLIHSSSPTPDPAMGKTRGGHSPPYRPLVKPSSPSIVVAPPPSTDPTVAAAAAPYSAVAGVSPALFPPANIRVGPTPPFPPHPQR